MFQMHIYGALGHMKMSRIGWSKLRLKGKPTRLLISRTLGLQDWSLRLYLICFSQDGSGPIYAQDPAVFVPLLWLQDTDAGCQKCAQKQSLSGLITSSRNTKCAKHLFPGASVSLNALTTSLWSLLLKSKEDKMDLNLFRISLCLVMSVARMHLK